MANWKKTILIKHLLGEGTEGEDIKKLVEGILEALKNEPTAPKEGFNKAIEAISTDQDYALFLVNQAMDSLYDWADNNRIWIG